MKWSTCIREHQNIQSNYASLRRIMRKLEKFGCPSPDVCTVGTLAWYHRNDESLPFAQVYLSYGNPDEFKITLRELGSNDMVTNCGQLSSEDCDYQLFAVASIISEITA